MLCGAIDLHKQLFQAAVLDPETGELSESRFAATREELAHWAMRWQGNGRGRGRGGDRLALGRA
jgi:hypothetical protein